MKSEFTATVKGDKLSLTIDLAKKGDVSSTGKSEVFASTGGYIAVDGTVFKVSAMVIKPIPKGQRAAQG